MINPIDTYMELLICFFSTTQLIEIACSYSLNKISFITVEIRDLGQYVHSEIRLIVYFPPAILYIYVCTATSICLLNKLRVLLDQLATAQPL